MEKPTVFLSHSSLDKSTLAALKKLLDDRAAGSLNFFLSSDGESIRFGRNWVVRISDALSQAKLMFVFISPHSADSKWIHFEAGCAYANDIQVVPVCLPGIDLNRITAPLNLLQGFNLHSYEAMGNLARICNETFAMKINESFNVEDFENIVNKTIGLGAGFFGEQTWAINKIDLHLQAEVPSDDFNPIPTLHKMCNHLGTNCHFETNGILPHSISATIEQPGSLVKFLNYEVEERVKKPGTVVPETVKTGRRRYTIDCIFSPELFQANARLLDQWFEQLNFANPSSLTIELQPQIVAEKQRQRFTSKLNKGGIKLIGKGEYEFDGLKFKFGPYLPWKIEFKLEGKLADDRLRQILERLFSSLVLWEKEPDFSEMFRDG